MRVADNYDLTKEEYTIVFDLRANSASKLLLLGRVFSLPCLTSVPSRRGSQAVWVDG